jgi:hypothetical protein
MILHQQAQVDAGKVSLMDDAHDEDEFPTHSVDW